MSRSNVQKKTFGSGFCSRSVLLGIISYSLYFIRFLSCFILSICYRLSVVILPYLIIDVIGIALCECENTS